MAHVFYNNRNVVVGKSQIMYNGKWYVVLYKTDVEDYLIIKYKGEYIKVYKFDVEDCKYNNTTLDNHDCLVLMKGQQLMELIEQGKQYIIQNYNIYQIYALVYDYKIYESKHIILYFDNQQKIINHVILDENGEWLINLINKFLSIRISVGRRNINKVIINEFHSSLYSTINEILYNCGIYKDNDNYKFKNYDVIIPFVELIEEL